MKIKIEISFFLILVLLLFTNCTVSKTEVATNTTQENTNSTEQNTDNSAEIQQDSATGGQAQPSVAAPDAIIKDLYKTHEKNAGTILNRKSRTNIDKYFDKNLGNLIWKDLTTHENEIGVIDFDLFYNSQDPDIKNLTVNPAKIDGTKATVVVNFTNSGQKDIITYSLVQQNSAWKVSDIKYKDGGSLIGYFKEDAKNNIADQTVSDDNNFEGTFQVGSTTATVTPIKMAFELKWAKGSGTMIFFYEGQGVLKFVSEDKGKGVDAFVFDDDTYKTGKFIRADGVVMPVKKIK